MYHATKFGIEGFCESVAQEVAKFHIKVTIVEPGGARTEFRYGSAKVGNLTPEYDHVHGFLNMLDASKGLAPGDPAKMAARIIESVDKEDTPLHMVLGSQALAATIGRLEERVAAYETQTELAASTDVNE
jgi:NAD(P)-dependent dehydrogenase (short-subunit alcohol dehydrogenase family)